jgi:hypothetical protein
MRWWAGATPGTDKRIEIAFLFTRHRAGDNKPLYLWHPQFEGFEVHQTVGLGKAHVA